ncbi:MAG TPA: methyltransferase domain-containing protein [Polyangiaceae bacterium]|nr:methyltransferase domain-containing protein [Polyangiaceae bacterium]
MHSVAPPPKDPTTEPGPWNAVAADYDAVMFDQLPELTDVAIELLAPEREDTILDVATGPGTLAVRLAPRVRRVIAIDFAEVMIERLRGHIMRSRLPNLEARLMNGQDLAFEDDSFDAAASMFGVFLFDDRKQGLLEMSRVVAPGGRAVISSWAAPEQNTLLGAGLEALRAALPDLPRPTGPLPTQQPDVCRAELEEAGFEAVETQLFQQSLRFESVEHYWRDIERASAPIAVLKQKLGDDAYAAAAQRALGVLRARLGDGAFTLDCCAILTSGEKPLSAA